MTAQTATASTVHHPLGKPGGPGLFHVKGMQLPAYIQNVAHAMIRSGKDKARAIQMAIGIVRNWAAGHDGHGNKVSAQVQAAAQKAIAEYNADRARAIATNNVAEWEAEIELAFDEALHPRGGAGTAAGGKFVAKGSTSPQAAQKQKKAPGKKKGAKVAGKPSGGRAGALRAKAAGLRQEAAKLSAEIKAAKKSLLAQLKSSRAARSTSAKAKAIGAKSKTATKKKAAVTKKKSTRAGGGASSRGGSGSSSIKSQQDRIARMQVRRNGLLKQAKALDAQAYKLSPGHGQALSRDITASYLELTMDAMDRSAPPETGADLGILGHQASAEEMVESINGMSASRRAMMRQLRNSDAPPGYQWTSRNRLIHLSVIEEAGSPKVLAVF